jgi:hypothetical protein
MKEFAINLVSEIVKDSVSGEVEIFEMYSDHFYKMTTSNKNKDQDQSYFGEVSDLISPVLLAIVIDLAKDVIKKGGALSKEAILSLCKKRNKKKEDKNITKLIKFLSEEDKDLDNK